MAIDDIRLAGSTAQALKMLDNKIERNVRRERPTGYARYERQAAGTTTLGTNQNTQLTFDTAVATDPGVAASGFGNLAFTLSPGRWLVNAGCRVQDSTVFANMGQLSIATGSATWAGSRARVAQNVPINSGSCCLIVVSDGTEIVTANFFCAVQRTYELTNVPHANFIEFTQV